MAVTLTKGYTFGSTELVTNTKMHSLVDDGSADMTAPGAIGGTTPAAGSFTSITGTGTTATVGTLTSTGILATANHALTVVGSGVTVAADSALVKITQDAATASEPALEIDNDGTGAGIELAQDGNGTALLIHQNAGNGYGIELDNNSPLHGLNIHQDIKNDATKHAAYIYSDIAHTNADSALLKITQDNAGASEPALEIDNDGTGAAIEIVSGTLIATPDAITATSDGVAASIKTINTEVTTNDDNDLDNVTLANGVSGQIKNIYCVVSQAGDTWKITPATMCGGTQITFGDNSAGSGCSMIYADSEGWVVIGNNGGTIS